MPKKTKDSDSKIETIKNLLTPKKSSKSKNIDTKDVKKEVNKSTSKKSTSTSKTSKKKNSTNFQSSSSKKVSTSTKETRSSKSTSKAKTTTKKNQATQTSPSVKKKTPKKAYSPEYYDLPYRYNKTVVKILAQTPTNLFIYWEISEEDRMNLKKQYGEYFFEITKPVLIIHNETMNYSFEIDIDDFANSWYLPVKDSNCQYKIELGRRPIPINYHYMPQYDVALNGPISPVESPYIYISSSNQLESPNDHILLNVQRKIYFRNVKTNQVIEKDIREFPFILKDNHFIGIFELYQKLYQEEFSKKNYFDFTNPSSGNPTSGNFSPKFQ